MKGSLFKILCFTCLYIFFVSGVYPQEKIDTLRIGVFEQAPFIMKGKEADYSGLSIDLWEGIALKMNVPFKYVPYSDAIGVVRALDYKDIDLAINPLENNADRMQKFEVSQPFHISSLGVAITSLSQSQFQIFINNFFSRDFLNVVLLLLLILLSFGTILWFVERRSNRYQFRPGILGLFDGLWWAAVTMTTVGYGDKAPKTNLGKTIAIIWMFTAVIIISSFTATIASTLTVNSLEGEISSLEQLKTVASVGVVGASSGADFLEQNGFRNTRLFRSPHEALLALSKKEVNALVYDRTAMDHLIQYLQLNENVQLLPLSFEEGYRSFMMPKEHEFFDDLNQEIIFQIQQDSWSGLLASYGL
ncbi:ion channel [Flagellimonas allohymeniacidonis]|uniref:Transporter substrate-binding domain-containing protein n=1 Tax=Flagellimonas allohymeniacidonis TaxID=2517819 RepID=A0A4Q8QGC4_9FLAO|nr:transporter substrate-binding domain-containing protein [Allomuricauda hymeniacidonis]TAI47643.1 transporter substrate-binding domain-containing protein [Allomuricauda hymeniacidonis]